MIPSRRITGWRTPEPQTSPPSRRLGLLSLLSGRLRFEPFLVRVRKLYFRVLLMLVKMSSKNQLTLPRAVTSVLGDPRYYEVRAEDGQIILTPVRIQRADAVRAKLARLGITEQDVADAVDWARGAEDKAR